jgi:SAM-dependent methyltransferase
VSKARIYARNLIASWARNEIGKQNMPKGHLMRRAMLQFGEKALKTLRTVGLVKAIRIAKSRLIAFVEDRRRGISASKSVWAKEMGIEDPAYHCYRVTDYDMFRAAMQHVTVREDEDVFVDYGSGKGRVLVMAAEYPFRKVIGVEFSAQLHGIAEKNVSNAIPAVRCKDIELVLADATQWALPHDCTVLYFYNPFHGRILAKVIENIRRSIAEAPRRLTIIFARPQHFEEETAWQDWLHKKEEFDCPEYKVAIYETKDFRDVQKQQGVA